MALFNLITLSVKPRAASLAFAIALVSAQPACAALGGAPISTPEGASVRTLSAEAARAERSGSRANEAAQSNTASPTSTAAWTVRETTLANGTVVREYVSQTGAVFGIAWSGPRIPDLTELLGSYFGPYIEGLKARRAAGVARGQGIVEGSGLVVHSGGHLGAFSGQAWLPQALPAGMDTSDIR